MLQKDCCQIQTRFDLGVTEEKVLLKQCPSAAIQPSAVPQFSGIDKILRHIITNQNHIKSIIRNNSALSVSQYIWSCRIN